MKTVKEIYDFFMQYYSSNGGKQLTLMEFLDTIPGFIEKNADGSESMNMSLGMKYFKICEKMVDDSLLMRVKKPEEAVEAARQCVGIAPDYDEGHLVLGMALIQNGNKSEGMQHLQRAKELGNTQADDLIKKYK